MSYSERENNYRLILKQDLNLLRKYKHLFGEKELLPLCKSVFVRSESQVRRAVFGREWNRALWFCEPSEIRWADNTASRGVESAHSLVPLKL